ncbi:LysE family transporter [candidate division KSB1 bacterium]|nr:LysE family transporter [candidate division KSB1 bacterium]
MAHYLILGITFAFAAAVQPGPLQAYLITQALAVGWRRASVAALSPLLSDGPIIAGVLLVLNQLPTGFVPILQLIGGIFLLYLAIGAFRTYRQFDPAQVIQVQSPPKTLLKATVVNLLNPNPYLAWSLVMGPLLLKGWRETPWHGMSLLIGFYVTIVTCLFGTMVLFSAARHLGAKVNRILIGISVLALAGFGFYTLWSGGRILF